MKTPAWQVKDYATADAFLSEGKCKTDRPLARNTRLQRHSSGDIAVRLHHTDIAVFHADGTTTVQTGGWKTVTTAKRLRDFTKARLWSDRGTWYLHVREPEKTPARVQRCRAKGCKGTGRVPSSCYGPSWCYGYTWGPDKRCSHGNAGAHREEECSHGQTGGHALDPVKCYRCDGTGQRDYGSKEMHYEWGDGYTRVLLDEDGYAVGPSPVPASYAVGGMPKAHKAPAPLSSHIDGHTVAGTLQGLLPDLGEVTDCPVCGSQRSVALHRMIVHLNDMHEWTRERVADWLDALPLDLRFPTPA